jgi:hypothetical protein
VRIVDIFGKYAKVEHDACGGYPETRLASIRWRVAIIDLNRILSTKLPCPPNLDAVEFIAELGR